MLLDSKWKKRLCRSLDSLQFSLAWVRAAKTNMASWTLVSFLALTAVTLAVPSAIAHCVVWSLTALHRYLALAG